MPAAARHLGVPSCDDVERLARFAFLEDGGPRGEDDPLQARASSIVDCGSGRLSATPIVATSSSAAAASGAPPTMGDRGASKDDADAEAAGVTAIPG
jgi:hypothetical protein